MSFAVRKFIKQPYPFYYEGKSFFIILGILFLMGFGFNYFFMPFNVNTAEHRMSYLAISFVHTLTALFLFFLVFLFFRVFPRLRNNWNVGKEIATLATFLLFTGIGQFLIRDIIYDNPYNWCLGYLIEEVRNTFMVGILFILILVPANFSRLYYRNMQKASNLERRQKEVVDNSKIFIKTHLKSDDFHLESREFIFARSEGNYVEICLLNNDSIEKLLKRISIKDLEHQLASLNYIVRTHRSYLVNMNYVSSVSGNAQGYRLQLQNSDEIVTVSRNMIPVFEAHYQAV
ncbi:LytR/AlgR family response regulator transcription factor [Poritiphilus flavus]|uniref:LytTR family transcriptional regulator n=1 Tax=Poritiphilus flavus TaxID=2697053 RepID=A0A6L9ECH9_9FLAO|nr:LytTR family DNA-binding domain-containing protein [Poritiphilus flavus]NAS12455.1 LytTR family transcriptional regulator [Poritiphilus flavus]